MKILGISAFYHDSAAALIDNGEIVAAAQEERFTRKKHDPGFPSNAVSFCMEYGGISLNDLDAIAVAKGPGSYTGLRVGVSTAKGLCYALDKPMIAVNTLEAMALQLNAFYPEHLLCPMIDARRMEVYAAVFDSTNNFVQETQAVIMDENSFQDLLAEHKVVFFGDGAAKCQKLLGDHPTAVFPTKEIRPSAVTVGELAVKAFENQHFENVATFEPYYLKDFMSPPSKKTSLPA